MGNTTRLPIDLKTPAISQSAGNSYWNVIALTTPTPDFDMGVYEFLEDVDGGWFGEVDIPNTIGATPAAKIILQVMANATSGVASIDVETRPRADGETLDVALDSTMAIQDVTMPTTAYELKEVTFTLPTSGNDHPVVAKDKLLVRIKHNGTKTEDTLAVPLLLVKAFLEIDLS